MKRHSPPTGTTSDCGDTTPAPFSSSPLPPTSPAPPATDGDAFSFVSKGNPALKAGGPAGGLADEGSPRPKDSPRRSAELGLAVDGAVVAVPPRPPPEGVGDEDVMELGVLLVVMAVVVSSIFSVAGGVGLDCTPAVDVLMVAGVPVWPATFFSGRSVGFG